MAFDSPFFLCVFLPLTVLFYTILPNRTRCHLLLGVSLLFCCFGSFTGGAVLTSAALTTYLLSLRQTRLCRTAGILMNLGLLLFYKYFSPSGLLAPIGISFFAFRCISYLADGTKAESFGEFFRYAVFFPQLTAGPITRFQGFRLTEPTPIQQALGFRRFLWGLGKKLLLVYPLSQLVTAAYGNLNFCSAWFGAVCYMLQIYLDFSGYSDMAIGLSQFFGASAPENFNAPYLAVSITDFWRRWHLSLSHWFRDYVYIPLGGSRSGKPRAALNKLLVFTLCGIWHGQGWTFLLWGLWHGILAAVETLHPVKKSLFSRLYTLLAVCLGFVLFRAADLNQAAQIFKAMVSPAFPGRILLDGRQSLVLAISLVLCFPVEKQVHKAEQRHPWIRTVSYVLSVGLLLVCLGAMAANQFQPFIYARF